LTQGRKLLHKNQLISIKKKLSDYFFHNFNGKQAWF
jgi:hypothetical protein